MSSCLETDISYYTTSSWFKSKYSLSIIKFDFVLTASLVARSNQECRFYCLQIKCFFYDSLRRPLFWQLQRIKKLLGSIIKNKIVFVTIIFQGIDRHGFGKQLFFWPANFIPEPDYIKAIPFWPSFCCFNLLNQCFLKVL